MNCRSGCAKSSRKDVKRKVEPLEEVNCLKCKEEKSDYQTKEIMMNHKNRNFNDIHGNVTALKQ